MPNYNSQKYLRDTIKSITQQTYQNWELIIVDDASDKKTNKVLKNFEKKKKIKIFYLKKNKGAAYCRNFALKKTKSEFKDIFFINNWIN